MRKENVILFRSIFLFLSIFILMILLTQVFALEEQTSPRTLLFFDMWALPRVWVGAILGFIGLILLMTNKVSKGIRVLAMVSIFFAFSIVAILPWGKFSEGMGLHPSPMCTIEKSFMFLQMGRAIPIVFLSIMAFILLMTLVANKLFCGWNCPIGAVQEIIYNIPLPKKYKVKWPFKITNTIRTTIFIIFLLLLFTTGTSLYAYLNPFEFLHWRLEAAVIPAFLMTFIAALFIYRPFCYLACPMGLVSWCVEHVSFIKVRLDKNACTDCMKCVKESPCPTVQAILDGKRSRPDCHACGVCMQVCPEQALRFKK